MAAGEGGGGGRRDRWQTSRTKRRWDISVNSHIIIVFIFFRRDEIPIVTRIVPMYVGRVNYFIRLILL